MRESSVSRDLSYAGVVLRINLRCPVPLTQQLLPDGLLSSPLPSLRFLFWIGALAHSRHMHSVRYH